MCPPRDVVAAGAAAAAALESAAALLEGDYPPVALAAEPPTSRVATTAKGGVRSAITPAVNFDTATGERTYLVNIYTTPLCATAKIDLPADVHDAEGDGVNKSSSPRSNIFL